MKRFDSGLEGEARAEAYLCQQGMTTLSRRYRGQDGEVDLVMQDGNYLVFVEVKYRPSAPAGTGLMAVTTSKQRRLTHAAMSFLVERELTERLVRFDVVEISRDGIIHIPNAFISAQ